MPPWFYLNLKYLFVMKTIKLIAVALLVFLLFFAGCIVNIVGDVTAPVPADPSMLKLISLALLAVYEVVVRVVPSVGDYSVVSWVIRILKKVSGISNVTKYIHHRLILI